ncbi:MAG: hypothetical protein QXR06_03535 [Candidatus Bathyarchaeia archaeon]|nr:hypothetical protein [Candidatus Bathyarchaeota archaeon]
MANIQRETAEIIAGALLLTSSFLISFFMVIGILEKSIILSIFALSSSFAGLTTGFHGIYGLVISRRKRK